MHALFGACFFIATRRKKRMRAFNEVFGILMMIFACVLFVITMAKAFLGHLALWQWIALVTCEIVLFALAAQIYDETLSE